MDKIGFRSEIRFWFGYMYLSDCASLNQPDKLTVSDG